MSFRELHMIDVREVVRRWQGGQSARQIARDGGLGRNTVNRYIEAAKSCGIGAETELIDALVAEVAQRVQARPLPACSQGRTELAKHRERVEAWLGQGLTLVRVQELLQRDGVVVPYTTMRRFVHAELGWREKAVTVRIEDPPPGDEAQIDFGLMGYVKDSAGQRHKLWALIVTLSMSRHMFVWPTFSQSLHEVCGGLDAAWDFFGGVPRRVVPDNMSTAVTRAHATDPTINRGFLEYVQARGIFVDPARVRRPQDKARVENQVPYVRDRWFGGEMFSDDLVVMRASAAAWCRDIAGRRVHGTTRRSPLEMYESEERPHMLPQPEAPFDVPTWSKAKVHPDHHAQVARALYSLPTRYIGKRLDVRVDTSTVRFYEASNLVKLHRRVTPGKRSTDANDYPTGKADYALRSVDRLKAKLFEQGASVGQFGEKLLGGPLPWIRMRQAYGLLRLCERYGAERVNALSAHALAFDVIEVSRVERMLKAAHKTEELEAARGTVVRLPAGRFAREASSFATVRNDGPKGGA